MIKNNNKTRTEKGKKVTNKSSESEVVNRTVKAKKSLTEQPAVVSTSSLKEKMLNDEYELKMKRVNDLIKEGYLRQAYAAMPDSDKFPSQSSIIINMKSDLMEKIWAL